MATVTLIAPDISCGKCKQNIERDLSSARGVRRVDVAVEPKRITIDYDESATGVDELRAALSHIGYPASG